MVRILLVLCLLILSAARDAHDDKGVFCISIPDALCSFATSQHPLTPAHAESPFDSRPIVRPNLATANMSDSGKPEEKPTAELEHEHEHEHEHEPEAEMNANEEVREAHKEVD